MVRRTSLTHLVDGDQRNVVLPHTANGNSVRVQIPENAAVMPAGHYMLFVNRVASDGSGMVVPSVSAPVKPASRPSEASAAIDRALLALQ